MSVNRNIGTDTIPDAKSIGLALANIVERSDPLQVGQKAFSLMDVHDCGQLAAQVGRCVEAVFERQRQRRNKCTAKMAIECNEIGMGTSRQWQSQPVGNLNKGVCEQSAPCLQQSSLPAPSDGFSSESEGGDDFSAHDSYSDGGFSDPKFSDDNCAANVEDEQNGQDQLESKRLAAVDKRSEREASTEDFSDN